MKRQLDKNKLKYQIFIFFLMFHFIFIYCKKNKPNYSFPFDNKFTNHFELLFLQIPYKEWSKKRIRIEEIHFPKNYIKTGIPTNYKPTFKDDGCFYFLDPFYFFNEFGFTFKYCSEEIKFNYQKWNEYIDQIDEAYIDIPSMKNIIISKTSINTLKESTYLIVYNTFLNENLKQNIKSLQTNQYYYSEIFINKNNNSEDIFLPKRFYNTEYALLLSNESIDFIYEIDNKLIKITIKDKTLVDEIIYFFRNIEEVLNDLPIIKDFNIDMIYFDFRKLKKIRIASDDKFVLINNPKNQTNLFLFPYSYLEIDLDDFEYELNGNILTIFLEEVKTVSLDITSKIYQHWMIHQNDMFIPLELCLWNPCHIKDLNYNEFLEDYSSENTCTINNFTLTEINPFGLYSDNTVTSYGKYIEIQSNQDCMNIHNKIYLNFKDILISFPEKIETKIYLFTASENYYIYNNKITNSKIQTYNIKEPIKLIRFFPYEERLLFKGFNNNYQYFIYGDSNSQIFKKIHSVIVLNENDWEFHDYDCIGTINCSDYAMSPGYDNSKNINKKKCEISELYVGGPKNSLNKRIATDEFIEFSCEKENDYNINILEIQYNNTTKKYYFPSPIQNEFVLLHDKPECIKPEQFLIYKDLIIPNNISQYTLNQQKISIGVFEIKKFINVDIPVSLNYIDNFNILLPSNHKASLVNCMGFATPNRKNQYVPYLFTNNYYKKEYFLISSDSINKIEIFLDNQKILETSLKPSQTISLEPQLFNFEFLYQRKLIKIIFDSTHIQYDEVFNENPLCFIDTIQIKKPEYLRICFLDNSYYDLRLKDNRSEIKIVPFNLRVPSYNHQDYFNNLEKNYYEILKNHCMILVSPDITLENFEVNQTPLYFKDSFLVSSNKNKIGNGLSTKEFIEIYTYVNNKKLSLCSYGIPEEKLYLFENSNETTLRHIYNWNFKSFTGLFHFNSY